jgi:peptidoglycan hydrolase-like protein with peptidoglycan-binding domain
MNEQPTSPDPAAQPGTGPQTPPQAPPTPPAADPRDDAIAQLRAELDEIKAQRSLPATPTLPSGPGSAVPTLGVPEPPDGLPDYGADWPQLGGMKLDSGEPAPQPWDHRERGLVVSTSDDGVTTIASPHTGEHTTIAAGAANHVSPIVPVHGRPLLGPLSSDPVAVGELGRLLATIGYATSVSEGRNPQGVVDESITAAVERFRQDFGVQEDPSAWPVDGERQARLHVGAWTWEALLRAAQRVRDAAAGDGRVIEHQRA